ncbi:hypothetical protein Tco_1083213 [Tanacetum coccineum]
MHENKSFNRNPANHRLYHALMEALIEDENAMDKGVADTVKDPGEDVVLDDDQPQDTSKPKTAKTPNPEWFKQPPRPLTLDSEWNKCQVDLVNLNNLGTCTSSIKLEYNFQECFNALTNKLNWNNPEGDQYLKSSDPEKTYTTSITKIKAARYQINGIKYMVPTLWSTIKHAYDKDAEKGIKH